ncbi:peptide/nickel transport system substrate-binding protein [Tistlia consotensis]|uniref:Peptide/nickel transport system substrate-binding protein n=1 Tax=Tistlia consotensis USBA 355 TaxID=560819 RepID=A0A1Y6C9U1_9PROT|nr:ABC transporter substrate-binding protein [Tistlia consotensis]SMF52144.1 peptide/nickel transport system substrate-binding protein [Tistlia consotensis USBA 355]SNR83283.1 peptide/nickel transport system substrate-binding protein [Tistlia consotensis]
MNQRIRGSILAAALGLGLGTGTMAASAAPAGTFRYAEEVKLVTLDPQQHSGGGISYLRPVYETLFTRSPNGSDAPLLATGYEIDGLSVKLTLRQGVKFSNGEPFDAAAVAANINRGVKLGILEGLKPVAEAVATGDHEVTIKLKRPDPSIIDDLTAESGMMIAPKAMQDPALDRNPVGTGPYVYDREQSREGEVRVYRPNPTYWDAKEQGLARVEIWELPDDTARLNALKTGQVDAGVWLSNPQAAIIDRTPGLKLVRNTGGYNYHLIILDRQGTKVPAFADQRVRQAMNYAIDRAAFSKAVQFGLSVPAYQPYAKGNWAYDPSLEGRYRYDPGKARELLKEAGYPNGFTFTMPSIPIFQSRLEAVAGFLKDVGITMTIKPVEPGTLARRSRTTDFPATNLVWNTMDDPKFLIDRYVSPDGVYNPYKVPPGGDLMTLGEQGLQSADPEKRAPVYRKMAEELDDQSFLIFITSTPLLFGVTDQVADNPTVHFRPGEDTIFLRGLRMDR